MVDETELRRRIEGLIWYHTIDFGHGIITPGIYDHRPYLKYYGFPTDLSGKRVLDIGTASGFFAFEFEKRGATVVATELAAWMEHDFGPGYEPDKPPEVLAAYLRESFFLAHEALKSKVERLEINIYDLAPEKIGYFDLVFCGSVLLHLTDPVRALWRVRSVTREMAIIATAIQPDESPLPQALFIGHYRADTWWLPNRACLEEMVKSAGFREVRWHETFRLDYRDNRRGLLHGVIHAFP